MKRNDWFMLAGVAVLVVFLGAMNLFTGSDGAAQGELRVDDKQVRVFPLNEDTLYRWSDENGWLDVEIQDGKARIAASSCKDQLCVRQGVVSAQGKTAICLPNRAVLRLIDAPKQELDAVTG